MAAVEVIPEAPGFLVTVFRRLRSDPLGLMGLVIVLLVLFCAVFGPSIAPYSPYKIKVSERFMPPTPTALFDGGDGKHAAFSHIFGTDNLGRDVFSRVLAGTQIALGVGGGSIAIALVHRPDAGSDRRLWAALARQYCCCCSSIPIYSFPTVILGLTVMTLVRAQHPDPDVRRGGDPDPGLCPADPHRHALDQELRIRARHPLPRHLAGARSCWCISCPISSGRCSSSPAWTFPR